MDELEFNPITTSYHAFIKHRGCARSLKALCECPLPFTLIKYVLNRVSWSKAHKSQSSADAWRLPIDIMDMLWFTASLFNGGYYVWGAGWQEQWNEKRTSLLMRSSTSPPAARLTVARWTSDLPFGSILQPGASGEREMRKIRKNEKQH